VALAIISAGFIYYNFYPKATTNTNFQISKSLQANHLHCEYFENPLGIGTTSPRLSWQIKADSSDKNVMQTAYQIQVASENEFKNLLWNTKKVNSDQSIHIEYQGKALQSRQRVFWRVRIWDNQGRKSNWSETAHWEMALLDTSEWKAKWIKTSMKEIIKENPSPMLRKDFQLKDKIKKARLYVTSLGMYEAFLNGKKVTDAVFTPGWTTYKKRLQYQTYDVTELLNEGKNAMGVRLGDGWFRSRIGWVKGYNRYGMKLVALLSQLEIEYKNGETETIISDENWKVNTGAVLFSTLYDGEIYDARLAREGWTEANYDDKNWKPVNILNYKRTTLLPQEGNWIKKIKTIKAQRLIKTPKGETVIDFGQNLVGWVKFRIKGERGRTVKIYHGEALTKKGNFYNANMRTAKTRVEYRLRGGEAETYEPHFTFFGFRYIKLKNFPSDIQLNDFEAVVIHSDMPQTGSFECSDTLVNRLQKNIEWSQRGNFLDILTDCPQRDERLGWTGDAQVFASTACFNFQTANFFTKWLHDLKEDQHENGNVPYAIPDVLRKAGSSGWGDAAVIVPYTLYLKYGDQRILEDQYESMKKWLTYSKTLSKNWIVTKGSQFGDWLAFVNKKKPQSKSGFTDKDLIATAFFAYSTDLASKVATILGKNSDAKKYQSQFQTIKKAFQNEYVTPNGRLSSHSQTAYILALQFNLLEDKQKTNAVEYLVELIRKRKNHLSTGFLGTPYICHVLTQNGYSNVAYQLLLQKSYPSWLYPTTRGATTIWERWDGIQTDSLFASKKLNSFNHYAYGAVGDWMYKTITGINENPQIPAYKHIILRPEPSDSLTFAKAIYQSLYGEIQSSWTRKKRKVNYRFVIPPNTTATLYLPKRKKGIELGSGIHEF
jgi:alpha-L-rhamnosidase